MKFTVKILTVLMGLGLFGPCFWVGERPAFADAGRPFFLSYFKDNGQAGVFLAYSVDGFKFTPLNNGDPIFEPPEWEGQNLTRDPSILYHDGQFRMVWTTSWTGEYFGAVSSPDLKQWSEPIKVAPFAEWPDDDSPRNTWAPEVHWIAEEQTYLILWSSATQSMEDSGGHNSGGLEDDVSREVEADPRYHRTFVSRSKDFQTFSLAQVFFDPGMSQIDAAMALDDRGTKTTADDRWLMAVKHEQFPQLGGKNIRLTSTQAGTLSNPTFHVPGNPAKVWTEPIAGPRASIQPSHMVEGPSLLRVDGQWRLYFDRFDRRASRYGLAVSDDLQTWSDRTDAVAIPSQARHGTVFRAPREAVAFFD